MMTTTSRLRQLGWGVILGLGIAGFAVLSLNVHAVRSEVLKADARLASLEAKKQLLETEFQARASQHMLARWNRIDLGYVAPRADQYVDTSPQLAALGQPLGPGAPSPIRVARADGTATAPAARRDMISPVSGRPITLAAAAMPDGAGAMFAETVSGMLAEVSPIRPAKAETGRGYAAESAE
jgi:hypothetical protein